ncbi:MAG TPA: hypothetical protein VGR06_38965 [Actinophytocola sp.]|uniref:hypothetical protein n=1 Tax=Actinophytocola sp. TaxID=1872138 RepID=UPI002DFE095D|nr:hypothetical protein [Actinophytocola sp.]
MRRAVLSVVLVAAVTAPLVSCKDSQAGSPSPAPPSSSDTATTTTDPSSSAASTTPTSTTTTRTTSSSKPQNPAPPPAPGGFPTPASTGVPAGTAFRKTVGEYVASTAGEVIDSWHITGALIIKARNVTIRNTQIDDSVYELGGSFTITDSLVGPATCGAKIAMPMAIGEQNYTAIRVHVRGHEDGFRAGGPNVVVKDSYYLGCVKDDIAHADGIQDYPQTTNVIVEHNTFDQSKLPYGYTAPIFVHSTATSGARIVNNLAIGGTYAVYLMPGIGSWTVTGNRVVAGESDFGAYEAEGKCGAIGTWADNDIVKIDSSYRIVATVVDNAPCGK